MFNFGKKENGEVSILLDIGNGTVTLAFVLNTGNLPPKFLYSTEENFPTAKKVDSTRLISSLSLILESLFSKAVKEWLSKPYLKNIEKKFSGALVTFSSPWFVLKTKQINLKNGTPFLITHTFLEDILAKEEVVFKNDLLKNAVNKSEAFEVIEKSIVHTKINGYSLENSIGNKTKSFDAFLCMSAVNKEVRDKVLTVFAKHTHLPLNHIALHTFPLALFSTVRDLFGTEGDFLLVDVTSEVIDVTFVKDSVMVGSSSIPSGRNFLLRQISKTFDTSIEIAESMLHLYIDKKSNEEESVKMSDLVLSVEKEWTVYFDNIMSENDKFSPKLAYVTAEDDIKKLNLNFSKVPAGNVVYINTDQLSHMYESAHFSIKVHEFLAILSTFWNKIRSNY